MKIAARARRSTRGTSASLVRFPFSMSSSSRVTEEGTARDCRPRPPSARGRDVPGRYGLAKLGTAVCAYDKPSANGTSHVCIDAIPPVKEKVCPMLVRLRRGGAEIRGALHPRINLGLVAVLCNEKMQYAAFPGPAPNSDRA